MNRDRDRDRPATLALTGSALAGPMRAWEVNCPDVAATKPFETPGAVDVRERKVEPRAGGLELTLPAHSLTVLRGELRRG